MEALSSQLKPSVIVFDVYETLLDMTDVERKLNILLENKKAYIIWFELFMEYCFVDNCTDQFNSFTSIAKATLQMAARKLDRPINDVECDGILSLLEHLPLKDGVQEGLSRLYDMNIRIAALTNASEKTVCHRMERTGLISYFEMVLSAKHVKKYKPDREVYQWAAQKLNVRPEEILYISSHGWDIAGAANAKMQTAYLKQQNSMFYPLAPMPTFQVNVINDLPEMLSNTTPIEQNQH